MARKKTSLPARSPEHDEPAAVDALIAAMAPGPRAIVTALRQVVRAADRTATEGVKWNSPSFHHHEWFATIDARLKTGVMLVLHQGASGRSKGDLREVIPDPQQLLTWRSNDRATIAFPTVESVETRADSIKRLVRQWVRSISAPAVEP